VLFGSKTGKTRHVAELIKCSLEAKAVEVTLLEYWEFSPEAAREFDAILVGSPTYDLGQVIREMKPTLKKLSKEIIGGKPCAAFGVFEWGECESADHIEEALKDANARVCKSLKVKYVPGNQESGNIEEFCGQFLDWVKD